MAEPAHRTGWSDPHQNIVNIRQYRTEIEVDATFASHRDPETDGIDSVTLKTQTYAGLAAKYDYVPTEKEYQNAVNKVVSMQHLALDEKRGLLVRGPRF